MWERLQSMFRPGSPEADQFLKDLNHLLLHPPGHERWYMGIPDATLPGQLCHSAHYGLAVRPEAAAWWQREIRGPLLTKYPAADSHALRWLADLPGYIRQVQMTPTEELYPYRHFSFPITLLALWVGLNPTPKAEEHLIAALSDALDRLQLGKVMAEERQPMSGLAGALGLLTLNCTAPPERAAQLLHRSIEIYRGGGPTPHHERHSAMWGVLSGLLSPLLERDALPASTVDYLFIEFPDLLRWRWGGVMSAKTKERMREAVDRLLSRVLEGDQDPRNLKALSQYAEFEGFDHFSAGCRALEQRKGEKFNLEHRYWYSDPSVWPVHILRTIKPPKPHDLERGAEMASLSPEALLNAAILAPSWSRLIEPHLQWPGLAALLVWLKRYGGPAPWSEEAQWNKSDEVEAEGAVDRAAALEAIGQMEQKRLKELYRHRITKALYRDGLFYLDAVQGLNAAAVEEGFLKRNKRAVRALGLLPDEGDILQRYLALRRFAKEARQFGAQRQNSERMASESALESLAVTAGFLDLSQLEWAMEAELARELDPSQAWEIAGYRVWVSPDQSAAIQAERDDKRLKSVPPAVRQAPEYAAVKEAKEQLQAQWERIQRRLELAMILGEPMDRERFSPALTTAAGQAMVPALVLRCLPEGADQPVDLLGGTTLSGEPFPLDQIAVFQVLHPLDLREAGTLEPWQRRLKELGLTQPFSQLSRELYFPTQTELTTGRSTRFAGRQIRVGPFTQKLKRFGWKPSAEGDMTRRLPGRIEASIWFEDGAHYVGAMELLHIGELHFDGPNYRKEAPPSRLMAEVFRELDLACAAANPKGGANE